MKKLTSVILAVVMLISFVLPASAADTLKLGTSKVTIGVGEAYTIKATGTTKTVAWSTSDKTVVTVKDGKITGKKAGTANITAKVGTLTAKVAVTVKKAPTKVTAKDITVGVGATVASSVSLSSGSASNAKTYVSSDTKIAKVGKTNGKITGVKAGSCTVTVTTFNKKTATFKVTVSEASGSKYKLVADEGAVVYELAIGYSDCTHDLYVLEGGGQAGCHTFITGTFGETINSSGKGWSYDAESSTLTLDGFKGSGIWAKGSGSKNGLGSAVLNIKLIGENTVKNKLSVKSDYAIWTSNCHLGIQGPGTLNINTYKGLHTDYASVTKVYISSGAVVNSTTYADGIMTTELIIESGCVVTAKTTAKTDESFVYYSPIVTTHTRCEGTLIGINANPKRYGIASAAYLTLGKNVTFKAGTKASDATVQSLMAMPGSFGDDTTRFWSADPYPYMEIIEKGYKK